MGKALAVVAVLLVVLAAVVAVVLIGTSEPSASTRGVDAGTTAPAQGTPAAAPAAEGGRVSGSRREREHSDADAASETLAIAGVVTSGGTPVGGARVEVFAVPEGVGEGDGREAAIRRAVGGALGDEQVARLEERFGKARKAGEDVDVGEMMGEAVESGLEMFTEDGTIEMFTGAMRQSMAGFEEDPAWNVVGSAVTDADGKFRVEAIPPGAVEVRVHAAGHVRAKVRVHAAGHVRAKRRAAAGAPDLTIHLTRGALLDGEVVSGGRGVENATVQITAARTVTGAGGRFRFDAAAVPKETVLVTAPGYVAAGRTVELKLDEPNAPLVIELARAGRITGRVTALGGGAVADALVSVGPKAGNPFIEMVGMGSRGDSFDPPAPTALTRADGSYELDGVKAGLLTVRISAKGFLTASIDDVDVKEGDTAEASVVLVRESVLEGRVTDSSRAAIAKARVRVESPSSKGWGAMIAQAMGGSWRSGVAADDGAYRVQRLTAGDRKVRVEAPGYLTANDTVTLRPEASTQRDFVLEPGHVVTGIVLGPDGAPLAGATVSVDWPDANGANAAVMAFTGGGRSGDASYTTDSDGRFSATGLQEGPYKVSARSKGFLPAEVDGVAAGASDVSLTLAPAATIRGRVIAAEGGTPVSGARVAWKGGKARAASGFAALLGGGDKSVRSQGDGTFEIGGLEAGKYELRATATGYADASPFNVAVSTGETFEGVELALLPGVDLVGRVVTKAAGSPVDGAIVWVQASGGGLRGMTGSDVTGEDPKAPSGSISSTSGADGTFVLKGLTPGKATLQVRHRDFAAGSRTVDVPAGDVNVELGVGGTVEGTVTRSDGRPNVGAQVIMQQGMMGQGARMAKADDAGAYRIERIPPGSYSIMLMDPESPMGVGSMGNVVVREGETTRHDFLKKAAEGRKVEGSVMRDGKPLANAPVMLLGSGAMKIAQSDEKGSFTFEGLSPGEYTVMVQADMMGGGTSSQKVTVGQDGTVPPVRIELATLEISGTVVDAETGKGVSGAQIQVLAPGPAAGGSHLLDQHRGQGFTAEGGAFTIRGVQAGTFTLHASAAGFAQSRLEGVAAGATGVRVALSRGTELVVTVVDHENRPVGGANVTAEDRSGGETMVFDMNLSGFTSQDGVARLRLAPGTYTVHAYAGGHPSASVEVHTAHGQVTMKLPAGAIVDVTVTSGGKPAAGAAVQVLDAAGHPVGRGMALDSFFGASDRTDDGGRWRRDDLPAGTFTVVAKDASGNEARKEVTLTAGGTTPVSLEVR